MQTDGHTFLQHLAGFPRQSFEGRFLELSITLRLGNRLNATELTLLYEAALYACSCNMAFNGFRGHAGEIRAHQEANRLGLELQFMAARDRFITCSGWRKLTAWQQAHVQAQLLSVLVDEPNLAS